MAIEVYSIEYKCWHEVGHAVAALTFGGGVHSIEPSCGEELVGSARARCLTNDDNRQYISCGGFAIEYLLWKNQMILPKHDEQAMIRIAFANSLHDRESYKVSNDICCYAEDDIDEDDYNSHEEKNLDEDFARVALTIVAPRIVPLMPRMKSVVNETMKHNFIAGVDIRRYLGL